MHVFNLQQFKMDVICCNYFISQPSFGNLISFVIKPFISDFELIQAYVKFHQPQTVFTSHYMMKVE